MRQALPHQSPSTLRHIAALVLAIVMFLVFAPSLPDLGQVGSDLGRQPLHAPAGLDL